MKKRFYVMLLSALLLLLTGCSGRKQSYVRLSPSELTILDGKPCDLRLVCSDKPDDVTYTLEGSSIILADRGLEGVTVTPVEDGTSTVSVHDSSGTAYSAVIKVIMPKPLTELEKTGAVTIRIICENIQNARITVTNNTDDTISFSLPAGSYLASGDAMYQDMLVTSPLCESVTAGITVTYDVNTCCMDIHRAVPDGNSGYTLSAASDRRIEALSGYFAENETDYCVRQAAVWILTNNATFADCGILQNNYDRVIKREHYDTAQELIASITS